MCTPISSDENYETGYRVSGNKSIHKSEVFSDYNDAIELAASLIADGFDSVVISNQAGRDNAW